MAEHVEGRGVSTLSKFLEKDLRLFRCWDVLRLIQIMLTLNLNFVLLGHNNFMTGPQLFKAV